MTCNRRSLDVTESADSPAVSTSDMKAFLRVDGTGDDTMIAGFVTSATELIKQYLGVGLLTETMRLTLDGFSAEPSWDRLWALGPGMHTGSRAHLMGHPGVIDLPFGPVQSITSIVTYDRANNASTFDAASYILDGSGWRVILNEGYTWPTELRDVAAVQITYVAGYGSGSIPAPIVEAIKLQAQGLYDGTCAGLMDAVGRMIGPYRRMDALSW